MPQKSNHIVLDKTDKVPMIKFDNRVGMPA